MNHEKDFFISGYLMPPRTDEAFSDLKAAGLNHIYIDYTEREQVRSEAFSLCDRWGIGAIVMTCWSRHDQPSFARVTAGVAGHPSFVGVNGLDEPLYEELDGIEREYDAFQARFPDKAYRRFRIEADFFADCSGDSILAEFSGAKLMRGREARAAFGESCAPERADLCTMGSSCLIQARETERPVRFTPPAFARRLTEEDFYKRLDVNDPRSFIQDNFWWIEIGGERDTLRDAEQIKHELLSTAYGVWDFIKNSGRFDSENWELDWVGFLSGKRESRRYAGDYVLSQRDLEAAGPFWDEVAYGGWSMDDHNPLGINTREAPNRNLYLHAPYAIPYRCLYSANVPNLFFAGRNVSVTHMALSSTRVMATCALMGQAVGNACALALARGVDARGVSRWMAELQQWLRNDDCFLPHVPRKASSTLEGAAHNLPEDDFQRLLSGIERKLDTEEVCVRLPVGQTLELRFAPVCCGGIRLVFDNDIARESCRDPGLRMYPQKLNVTRSDSPAQIPPNLVKAYEVHVLRGGRWEMLRRETENYLRLVRIPVSGEIEGIRFVGRETYGAPEIRLLSLDVEE